MAMAGPATQAEGTRSSGPLTLSLAEQIAARLSERIVDGSYAPGQRVMEQAVSAAEPAAWVKAQAIESQVEFAQMPARIGSGALAGLGAMGLTMAIVGLCALAAWHRCLRG